MSSKLLTLRNSRTTTARSCTLDNSKVSCCKRATFTHCSPITARWGRTEASKGSYQRKQRRSNVLCGAAAAPGARLQHVEDIMTQGRILTCTPETALDDALEMLVEHHVTGLPVVNENNVVVGVVSDFDLLALEGISAQEKAKGFFPDADTDWNSFFEIQKLVAKNAGKNVGDVMTADPVCVTPETSIEEAANLLLRRKIRRLPVVDQSGVLVGIITRSNVIKAAWEARKSLSSGLH